MSLPANNSILSYRYQLNQSGRNALGYPSTTGTKLDFLKANRETILECADDIAELVAWEKFPDLDPQI